MIGLCLLAVFLCEIAADDAGCESISQGTKATYDTFRYTPFCPGTAPLNPPLTVVCPVTLVKGRSTSGVDFKVTSTNQHQSATQYETGGIAPIHLFFELNGELVELVASGSLQATLRYQGEDQTLECGGGHTWIRPNVTVTCDTNGGYQIEFDFKILINTVIDPTNENIFKTVIVQFTANVVKDVTGLLGSPGRGTDTPFVRPDGTVAPDYVDMQNSWALGNIGHYSPDGCTFAYKCDGAPSDCYGSDQTQQAWAGSANCSGMNNANGGNFQQCWQVMPAEQIGAAYKQCIEQIGPLKDEEQKVINAAVCEGQLYPFMSTCRAYGIRKWGNETVFPRNPCPSTHSCPLNSHYDEKASVCFNTCVNPYHSKYCPSTRTAPRCECDYYSESAHYVYDNGRCILLSQCGLR